VHKNHQVFHTFHQLWSARDQQVEAIVAVVQVADIAAAIVVADAN
jgi:hypothetical protein